MVDSAYILRLADGCFYYIRLELFLMVFCDCQIVLIQTNVASEDAKTSTIDSGLAKSLTMYRKLIESGGTLTDEQQAELEKKIKVIQERDVVEADTPHDPLEIEFEKNISIGPPTLTRFEKARILGARALQLSLGAPTFIPIPEYANISLDIAMEELKQRVMPIVIKRTLPNGDYQNIGIEAFQ